MGFEQMTWQRGNRSLIFRGKGSRSHFGALNLLYVLTEFTFESVSRRFGGVCGQIFAPVSSFPLTPSFWFLRLHRGGDGGGPRQAAGVLRDPVHPVSHGPLSRLPEPRGRRFGPSGDDATQRRAGGSKAVGARGDHSAGHPKHRLREVRIATITHETPAFELLFFFLGSMKIRSFSFKFCFKYLNCSLDIKIWDKLTTISTFYKHQVFFFFYLRKQMTCISRPR